jgi:hypothetical protein
MGGTSVVAPTTQVFSERGLERRRIQCECIDNMRSSFLNYPTRKSFKRLPTAVEWARFKKYARRVREFTHLGIPEDPSLEVTLVMQLYAINELLLPNLKTLNLWGFEGWFIPAIPLFLSTRTTSVLLRFHLEVPKAAVASMITTLPTLCPNLQEISLYTPSDPVIAAAVSGMLLVTNRNSLQRLRVDSPLTEEASEVLYRLPNLRSLSAVVERGTPLPSASLPSLTDLRITCGNEDDWPRLLHGATLGKLVSVTFDLEQSDQIGDFLGAFEKAALSSSLQNTLSKFCLDTDCSWNPNYSSLLPFTQLVYLVVGFACYGECSSTVDDDIIVNLSRAMPKLETLYLGGDPCRQTTAGVTKKGLVAVAHHCPNLLFLRIHFRADSLSDPPATHGIVLNAEPVASSMDYFSMELDVGDILVPEESALSIALTLLHIFPRIEITNEANEGWEEVRNAIKRSRGIADFSSKQRPITTPEVSSTTTLQEPHSRPVVK